MEFISVFLNNDTKLNTEINSIYFLVEFISVKYMFFIAALFKKYGNKFQ